jgi:hypothetical protein
MTDEPRDGRSEGGARIEDLRAEARYRRERLDLYRAKMQSARPTTPERLRELEQEWRRAQDRLDFALREDPPA